MKLPFNFKIIKGSSIFPLYYYNKFDCWYKEKDHTKWLDYTRGRGPETAGTIRSKRSLHTLVLFGKIYLSWSSFKQFSPVKIEEYNASTY